jgi:MFS family permease
LAHEVQEPIGLRLQWSVYLSGGFASSISGQMHVILPLWLVMLHPSPLVWGIALASRTFLPFLFAIPFGALMDKVGARRVILCSSFVLVGSVALFPTGTLIPWLIVINMIAGLAATLSWIGAQTLVGQRMQGDPTYTGRLSLVTRIGELIGPPVAGYLWDVLGPYAAFGFITLWAVGGVVGALMLPKTDDERTGAMPSVVASDLVPRLSHYMGAFYMMAIPAVLLVVMVSILRQAGQGMQSTFYIVYLIQEGYSGTAIGTLLAIFPLVGALVTPTVGPLAKRVNNAWLAIAMVGGSIVMVAATPLLGSYTILMAAIAFRGSMVGLMQPLMISMIAQAAAAGDQGKGVGLRATANRLAVTFTPIIMGGVIEFVGLENGFYVVGSVLLILLMGVAIYVKSAPGFRT